MKTLLKITFLLPLLAGMPGASAIPLMQTAHPAEQAATSLQAATQAPASPQAPASATDRAAEILGDLAAGFHSMKSYGVQFTVTAGEQSTHGRYAVEDENYYLILGDAEVFCDGRLRYEVDNRRREITINDVDLLNRNILNNPVHAFDFLGSEYSAALLWERDGKAAVRLTPVSGRGSVAGSITVTVRTAGMQPLSLSYDYDGERIDVSVDGVAPLAAPLKSFDRAAYKEYEMIDFR